MIVRHMISGVLYKGTMKKIYPEPDFMSVAHTRSLKKNIYLVSDKMRTLIATDTTEGTPLQKVIGASATDNTSCSKLCIIAKSQALPLKIITG